MTQADVEAFVSAMSDVQREDAYGYTLYFVGGDRRLPFVTIADCDQEFDRVSKLDRDGVFRINIGVSKGTFDALVDREDRRYCDHRVLDRFLPHPHYAKQNWVCILNPVGEKAEQARRLIGEAHSIAAARWRRKAPPPG